MHLSKLMLRSALLLAICVVVADPGAAEDLPDTDNEIRVLSWNVSGAAFTSQEQAFNSILQWASPDVVLLDEVSPSTTTEVLISRLAALSPVDAEPWNVSVGESGGRQRTVVATRKPLQTLAVFQSQVPYSQADQRRIRDMMPAKDRKNPGWSMAGGIPVNGAIVQSGQRKLLLVIADLQCCGDGPESWQELRRRVEAREIRRLIAEIMEEHVVDGIVLAGDFNMVNSTFPLALLLGPYPQPHAGLIPAEAYHANGESTWTWDGRGTPFPSNVLDYQFYSPHSLRLQSGSILDSEGTSPETREKFELELDTSSLTGRHRPVVIEYQWN